jgi:hypothetical protein
MGDSDADALLTQLASIAIPRVADTVARCSTPSIRSRISRSFIAWAPARKRARKACACGSGGLSPARTPAGRQVTGACPCRSSGETPRRRRHLRSIACGLWVARPLLAVKTNVTVSGWLSEPDVPTGDADIERMDPLDGASAHGKFGRPLLKRVVAPPSLVSRLLRKSMGLTIVSTGTIDSLARLPRPAGLPPAVALALALARD